MAKLTLITINNPFDVSDRTIRQIDYVALQSIAKYIESPVELVVGLNGHIIGDLETTIPKAGDCITLCPVLEGGRGDNKSILRAIAMIAVMVVAAWAAPYITGVAYTAQGAWITYAVAGALNIVGGLLVNALIPPPDLSSSYDTETKHSWSGAVTTVGQGSVVPIVYGKCRTGGHVISAFTELRVENANEDDESQDNMLCAVIMLSEGPIDPNPDTQTLLDSSNLLINDQPATNYYLEYADAGVRFGTNDQTPAEGLTGNLFDKIVTEGYAGAKITTNNYMHTGDITNATSFDVSIIFPYGLYKQSTTGGDPDHNSVSLILQFQKVGEGSWHEFSGSTTYPNNLTAYTKITPNDLSGTSWNQGGGQSDGEGGDSDGSGGGEGDSGGDGGGY